MFTGPTHFKYFCSRCQVEHLQPFSGPAPRPEDIPTSCGNDFPTLAGCATNLLRIQPLFERLDRMPQAGGALDVHVVTIAK